MTRILVALDTSSAADLVLTRAVELARSLGGKLRLLRVVPDAVSPAAPNLLAPMGDAAALMAAAESDLTFREEGVPMDLRDGVTVEIGQPWRSICSSAQLYDADLVVIGAHRYGLIDRVLGTTAARVVNHIDRPVFIVRPNAESPTRSIAATATSV